MGESLFNAKLKQTGLGEPLDRYHSSQTSSWFTEGFETAADLKDAKALLDELSA
jgi:hypothetical protein